MGFFIPTTYELLPLEFKVSPKEKEKGMMLWRYLWNCFSWE